LFSPFYFTAQPGQLRLISMPLTAVLRRCFVADEIEMAMSFHISLLHYIIFAIFIVSRAASAYFHYIFHFIALFSRHATLSPIFITLLLISPFFSLSLLPMSHFVAIIFSFADAIYFDIDIAISFSHLHSIEYSMPFSFHYARFRKDGFAMLPAPPLPTLFSTGHI
jgi:hypothetical protein